MLTVLFKIKHSGAALGTNVSDIHKMMFYAEAWSGRSRAEGKTSEK